MSVLWSCCKICLRSQGRTGAFFSEELENDYEFPQAKTNSINAKPLGSELGATINWWVLPSLALPTKNCLDILPYFTGGPF